MRIAGEVVSSCKGIAEVRIERTSACGHPCETCGACAGRNHVFRAIDPIGCVPGDRVMVETREESPLWMSFCVYLLPVLMGVGFCFLCRLLWGEAWMPLGILAAGIVWGAVLLPLNKGRRNKAEGTIVEREISKK